MKGTIKSSAEITSFFSQAHKVNTKSIIALVKPTKERRGQQGRVAFLAGKKLGKAPLRSRAKRVMREAARAAGAPWVGVDSVFVAREGTAASSPAQLARDMETIKKRHG